MQIETGWVRGGPVVVEERTEVAARSSRSRLVGGLGRRLAWTFSILSVLLGLWEGVRALLSPPAYVLPSVASVARAGWSNAPALAHHGLATAIGVVIAVVIGFAIGSALSLLLAHSAAIRARVMPVLTAFEGIPKLVFAPILVVWLGLGLAPKVALGVAICLYPITVQLSRAMRSVDTEVTDYMAVLGVRGLTYFRTVTFPASIPAFIDALRLAVPGATIGIVVGEFISANRGLGFLIMRSSGELNTALAFAAIIVLGFGVGVVQPLARFLENRFLPWIEPSAR